MTQPTILLSIANGFAARFLVRSGVLDVLRDENRVVVVSPNAGEKYFSDEIAERGAEIRLSPSKVSRLADNFERSIWQTLTPGRDGADALVMELIDRLKENRPGRHRVLSALNGFVSSRPALVSAIRKVDRIIARGRDADALFDDIAPDLVVVTSAGYEAANLAILRRAKKRGIRSVNAVLGWDNLSTRGPMREQADKLIVWNEINRQEAVTFHGYDASDVYVGGVPHFDVYSRPWELPSWEEYCLANGLDPSRRLVTIGGTTPDVTDGFDDVVALLARAIDEDRFSVSCQLLIRPHPIVYSGWTPGQGMPHQFDAYRAMGRHVHCDQPRVMSRVLMADLAPEDSAHLAATLSHSSVLVNFFSTLMVDAAAADCPTVSVAFDGNRVNPYSSSARRIQDIRCIRNVLETGAVRVAEDANQLLSLVERALSDRTQEVDERRLLAERMCFQLDGMSAVRYANRIGAWARGNWTDDDLAPASGGNMKGGS